MDVKKLAGHIERAGKVARTLEFKCPFMDGVYVMITFMNRFIINQMNDASVVRRKDYRRRGAPVQEDIDNEKFRDAQLRWLIKGWKGVTVAKLAKLLPGFEVDVAAIKEIFPEEKIETDEDAERVKNKDLPFDKALVKIVLEASIDFDNWIWDTAMDATNFGSILETEEENLENLE